VHCSAVRFWQVTPAVDGMQHAPVWTGWHEVEAHDEPGPWNTPWAAMHAWSVRSWQVVPVGSVMQHAPVGGWQVVASQIVPSPR
jgi:hypothetical protein